MTDARYDEQAPLGEARERLHLGPVQAADVVHGGVVVLLAVATSTMVIARIMGAIASRALQAVHLGGIDRAAGILFGALKGAACIGLMLTLLDQLAPTPAVQIAIQGSFLGPQLIRVATSALEVGRELSSVASEV